MSYEIVWEKPKEEKKTYSITWETPKQEKKTYGVSWEKPSAETTYTGDRKKDAEIHKTKIGEIIDKYGDINKKDNPKEWESLMSKYNAETRKYKEILAPKPSGNKLKDLVTRTGQMGANMFMGATPDELAYANPISTGSNKLDKAADLTGGVLGFAGGAKAHSSLSRTMGGVGLMGKGIHAGRSITPKLGRIGQTKLGRRAIEGAGAGVLSDVAQGLKEHDDTKELAKRVAYGVVFGAGIDIGGHYAGQGAEAFAKSGAGKKIISAIADKIPKGRKLTPQEAQDLAETISRETDIPVEQVQKQVNEVLETPRYDDIADYNMNVKNETGQLKSQTENTLPPEAQKTVDNILKDLDGASVRPDETARSAATLVKDKSGFSYNMTDIYRNLRDAFGKNFDHIKKTYLDPFDASKKGTVDMERAYTDKLYNNIVKKLGIGKNTKLSKAVQEFGEGKRMAKVIDPQTGKKMLSEVPYTLDDLKADFPTKWKDIEQADKWFRKSYNELIDTINKSRKTIYPDDPSKLIPKRKDYYRHFREMSDTFAGVKNLFETPSQIDPSLAGVSDFTQPRSRFLKIAQRRGMGPYKADAVGGFLDYIKAASYATHIDPHVSKFRGLAKDIAESTGDTRNANNLIEYLQDFANDLAGKTNALDRTAQKYSGRKMFKILNWVNSRVKSNTVLGNVSSALSQIANVPQGIAFVKNPIHLTKGAGDTMASFLGQGRLANKIKESQFLSERFSSSMYSRFDTKIMNQPKKFAAWMLGALDEVGTKFIWSSAYNKAIAEGMPNAIKYADDNTRRLVAGRGIGELPLAQKSKLFQFIAPFQVEVTNLWNVQRDFVKDKDFGGLAMLYVANYILNKGMEEVRGSGVVFDPIAAIEDSIKEDLTLGQTAGRLGGEVLSNIPLGQTIAAAYPEYGTKTLPTRKEVFGDNDPTRFGSGLLSAKALQDPLYKLLPSFGGNQAKKTIKAAQDFNLLSRNNPEFNIKERQIKSLENQLKNAKGETNIKNLTSKLNELKKQKVDRFTNLPFTASYTAKGDKLRTPIKPTASNITKGLLFGEGGINEVKDFFKNNKTPYSQQKTQKFITIIEEYNFDPYTIYEAIDKTRGMKNKEDIVAELKKNKELTADQKNIILTQFYDYKTYRGW